MALQIYDKHITLTNSGETVPSATLQVNNTGASTSLATLWQDRAGTIPAANPFTADSLGRVQFYLESGRYTMLANYTGGSISYPDVTIGPDPDDLGVTFDVVETKADYAALRATPSTDVAVGDHVHVRGFPDPWEKKSGWAALSATADGWYLVPDDYDAGTNDVYYETTSPNRTADLYLFGGEYEGDCTAAMDRALSNDKVQKIIVPDNVTLGQHTWSADRKTIVGGDNVTFDTSVTGAGFLPVNCEFVRIEGFKDVVCSQTEAHAHKFLSMGGGANIGRIEVFGNTGSGGVNGLTFNFENGRTIGHVECGFNEWDDAVGEDGGEGYGIQYANENATGTGNFYNNIVRRAGRHSFYFARNAGGLVKLTNNTAIDHRENSTITRGNFRPAFYIVRGGNTLGYGNTVNGYYDGAIGFDREAEPPELLNCENVLLCDTTIKNPKNALAAVTYGTVNPKDGGLRNIQMVGLNFEADGINANLLEFNYGHDILFKDVFAWYKNIPAGNTRPLNLMANNASNSSNQIIENVNFTFTDADPASSVQVFRWANSSATGQVRTRIKGYSLESDSPSNTTHSSAAIVDNALIELFDCPKDGISFNTNVGPGAIEFPSLGLLGSVAWAAGTINDGQKKEQTVTVTGAVLGDIVVCSIDDDTQGVSLTADVTSADTVTATLSNNTGGNVGIGNTTLKALVLRQ